MPSRAETLEKDFERETALIIPAVEHYVKKKDLSPKRARDTGRVLVDENLATIPVTMRLAYRLGWNGLVPDGVSLVELALDVANNPKAFHGGGPTCTAIRDMAREAIQLGLFESSYNAGWEDRKLLQGSEQV